MARNSSESDRGSSRRSRYSKAMTPLPPLPSSMTLSVFQGNPAASSGSSTASQMHLLHHHSPANMRTPVAWSLRDANLSRPASIHVSNALPFSSGMSQHQLHQNQQQLHHQNQMLLNQHQMQMQVRQQNPHHHYTSTMPVNPRYMPSSSSSQVSSRNPHQNQHNNPQNVNMNGQQNHHRSQNSQQNQSQQQRPSSPSATTTSSDDREEVPMVRNPRHRPHGRQMRAVSSDRRSVMSRASRAASQMPSSSHHLIQYQGHPHAYHPHPGITIGTLRSTKSVPSLAIHPQHGHHMDHDCPVHRPPHPGTYSVIHGPVYAPDMTLPPRPRTAAGSIIDVRTLVPHHHRHHPNTAYSVVNFMPEKKAYGMQLPLPAAPMSVMQGGTLYTRQPQPAIIAVNGPTAIPTKLSVQPHPLSGYYEDTSCCKGHLIVLWIILGVVTLGVISGIVLGVTMN